MIIIIIIKEFKDKVVWQTFCKLKEVIWTFIYSIVRGCNVIIMTVPYCSRLTEFGLGSGVKLLRY